MSSPRPDEIPAGPGCPPVTVGTAYREAVAALGAGGIPGPELDARLIVCHSCGLSHERFAIDRPRLLDRAELELFQACLRRRLMREPVSRIIGRREFFGLEFSIGPQTLDPRPDTETVVAAVVELSSKTDETRSIRMLDLGTGSGCILISLLHALPSARGVGTDISSFALAIAAENATRLAVSERADFVCTNWADGLAGTFDVVISNPPYINTLDIDRLEPEVCVFDPWDALDGGSDGLAPYREILASAGSVLSPGGWLVFEVGEGKADDVLSQILAQEIFFDTARTRQWRDLSGTVRCVAAKRSSML